MVLYAVLKVSNDGNDFASVERQLFKTLKDAENYIKERKDYVELVDGEQFTPNDCFNFFVDEVEI
jgi:hypothetical protein